MKHEEMYTVENHYRCSECGEKWIDRWDCACNDRCPVCDSEIEPYESVWLEDNVKFRY